MSGVSIERIEQLLTPRLLEQINQRLAASGVTPGAGASGVQVHTHQNDGQGGQISHRHLADLLEANAHVQYASADGMGAGHTRTAYAAARLLRQIITTGGIQGGATLTSDVSISIDTTYDFTWTGLHVFEALLTTHDIEPEDNSAYNIGSDGKRYSKFFVDNLAANLLVENHDVLLGQTMYVAAYGKFPAAVASGATVIDLGLTDLDPGDFLLIRYRDAAGAIATEYMQIVSSTGLETLVNGFEVINGRRHHDTRYEAGRGNYNAIAGRRRVTAINSPPGSSGTTYNVTRDVAGAPGTDPAWDAGVAFMVLGQAGDFHLVFNKDYGISHREQSNAYNQYTTHMRLGRVDDLLSDINYESHGFVFGTGFSRMRGYTDQQRRFLIDGNYDHAQSVPLPGGLGFREALTPVAGQTVYSLSQRLATGSLHVLKNGLWLFPGASNDYTENNNQSVVFLEAPTSGPLYVRYRRSDNFDVLTEALTGTIDGSNTVFTTSYPFWPGTVFVYHGAVTQHDRSAYVEGLRSFTLAAAIPAAAQPAHLMALTVPINDDELVAHEELSGTKNGVNLDFVFSNTPDPLHVLLVYNGRMLRPDVDYTISGATATLAGPPASAGRLWSTYLKA